MQGEGIERAGDAGCIVGFAGKALALLEALQGAGREALRIGLSGTPGVGKSTFIIYLVYSNG